MGNSEKGRSIDEQILIEELEEVIVGLFKEKLSQRGIKFPETEEETKGMSEEHKAIMRSARDEIKGHFARALFTRSNLYIRPALLRNLDQEAS